jgi:anti-anti-sigma regulatory factor
VVRKLASSLDGVSVCIDVSGLTFVDSRGLHSLVAMKRQVPAVRLVNPSPHVRQVAELVEIDAFLFDE